MTGWLVRLRPRSLTAQIVLAAALALLVAQAINLVLLLRAREQQSLVQSSSFAIARMVNAMDREAMAPRDRAEPHRRARLIRRAPLIGPDLPEPVGFEPQAEMEERAVFMLRQSGIAVDGLVLATGPISALPNGLEARPPQGIRTQRNLEAMASGTLRAGDAPSRAVLLSIRRDDGRWMSVAVPMMPRERTVLGWLILQTLVLYLAVLIALAVVAGRIGRPLRRLAGVVRSLDLSAPVRPMAEEGPDDVARLIGAFNDLQTRVSMLLSEKDVMLGAIGHDLKTPLSSLRIRIESVEDDEERDRMAETIDEIVTILDDILTLARLGKSGEAREPTDIGALVETLADEFADTGAAVACAPHDSGPIVASVRPILLRRALRNLIDNAVHYGGKARISLERSAGRVAIHIDDSGPGMADADLRRMQEPFVRGDESRNRATGGSGLGLTLAAAIARAHDGSLLLANRAEGGLRATIRVPA